MSFLFYYKILLMTELVILLVMFTFRMKRRPYFPLRACSSVVALYVLAVFYPLVSYSGWYSSLMFIVFFLAIYGAVLLCFNISWQAGFYIATISYTIQHFTYEIFALLLRAIRSNLDFYSSAIMDFSSLTEETLLMFLVFIEINLVVYVVSYFILGKRIHRAKDIKIDYTAVLFVAFLILLVDIIINAFVVYIDSQVNESYEIVIAIYNILCCIMVLFILLSILKNKKMETDMIITKNLLAQARKQYDMSRENIDAINMKVHDMKHMINEFARKKDLQEKAMEELSGLIKIYDSNYHTGNEALDIILTEKSLSCTTKDISLSCMADGRTLSFMDEPDLYVLFGNAISNAMEAVSDVKNKEDRFISLNVHSKGDLVSISISNYFEHIIDIGEDGLPLTSKKDKENHGFGIRSMKLISENYGGDCSISIKDNIFTMNILIPKRLTQRIR